MLYVWYIVIKIKQQLRPGAHMCPTDIPIRKTLDRSQSKLHFCPLSVRSTSDPLRTHLMADDRSSAASGGESGSDDDRASLLREAEPDDVEEVALRIA